MVSTVNVISPIQNTMGLLDDFLNAPSPSVGDMFANKIQSTVVRRDTCHVCDKPFTLSNPQFKEGSYWCTQCGDYFDGCSSEPAHHRMWVDTGEPDCCTTKEPLGVFIGFAGYNQLLLEFNLEPKHVVTTHPREGVLYNKWYEVHEKHAPGWNRRQRKWNTSTPLLLPHVCSYLLVHPGTRC